MGQVVVAGSINMDVVATVDRHPAIGETVAGREVLYFPGGKGANQAVAAAKLGAATMLIGCTGADAFGRDTRAFLAMQGVDLAYVREVAGAGTGTAIITVANTIVVIPGANALVNAADVAASHSEKAISPSANSRFRCRPSRLSSRGRANPVQRRFSIRHRRCRLTVS